MNTLRYSSSEWYRSFPSEQRLIVSSETPKSFSRGKKKEVIIQRDGTAATDLSAPRTVPKNCCCESGGGGRGGPGRAGPSGAAPTPPPAQRAASAAALHGRPTSAPDAAAAGRAPAPPLPGERPRGGPGRAAPLPCAVLALPVRSPRGSGEGRAGAEDSLPGPGELPGPRWPSFGVPGCDAWQNWESPLDNLQPKHLVRYSAATGLSQTNFAAV